MSEKSAWSKIASSSRSINTDDDKHLLCPHCGFDYMHPISVKVATYDEVTEIDSHGTRIIKGSTAGTREAPQGRGVRIIIRFHCEDGHNSDLVLQFHKGNTLAEMGFVDSECSVIWRD